MKPEEKDESEGCDHEHVWGAVQRSRFTGTIFRKCIVVGCNQITLDMPDDEGDEGDES